MKKKKKMQVLMNKPAYLGLSILKLSKILMHEFWFDYVKPEYGEKAKFCYMETDSLIFLKILQKMLKQDLILHIMN